MNKNSIIFWITTVIFSIIMIYSAYNYLTSPNMDAVFKHLGFPDYFKIELAIAKILGVLALLLPFVPRIIKQFAYAGFTINLFSATIAHGYIGDPWAAIATPSLVFGLMCVSYIYFEKMQGKRI